MIPLILPVKPIVILPPAGASQLPLVEIDKAKVQTKHKSILFPKAQRHATDCSYGPFGRVSLQFTAWELCHAAKKSELTSSFTPGEADRLALLFADEHHKHFIWNTNNLRCADGSGRWLEDFSAKGLAGRVGEALAYLTMTKVWGYAYWDRITSIWMRAAHSATINHADMAQVTRFIGNPTVIASYLQPDFAFEKPDRTVALMEAKGSFVTPGNSDPKPKAPLKHGLDQLTKWASLITPAPAKCIAIDSLLRESGDSCSDPSLILHVDPPGEGSPDIDPVTLRPDAIRRGNFGSWLMGMGFRISGLALTECRMADHSEVELTVTKIHDVDFALIIRGWCVGQRAIHLCPWCFGGTLDLPWRDDFSSLRHIGVTDVYALGIEVRTLRAVCTALMNPSSNVLMDLPTIDYHRKRDGRSSDGFYGSVFPDGSLMGIVSIGHLESEQRTEKFLLGPITQSKSGCP